jgi:hypothetical protein
LPFGFFILHSYFIIRFGSSAAPASDGGEMQKEEG